MDRLACISVPSLPLQMALRRFQGGHKAPLVLVKEDRPTSSILHLNRAAKDQGLRIGMRYSEALSIVCDLKAVTVSAEDFSAARQEILEALRRWSPVVEACPFDAASFWLNAQGLTGLYGTEAQWGASIRSALATLGYHAVVVVGLTRGGTYVVAQSRRRSTVVRSAEAERRALNEAPLAVFPLAARHRRLLERLGLTTLAGVLKIPAEELSRRFGPDLVKDLRQLESFSNLPLQSLEGPTKLVRTYRLESPVSDRQTLLPLVEGPLEEGLAVLSKRARLLAELRLIFVLESGDLVCEVLRPAEPTTNRAMLLRLLDLRLASCSLPTAVVEIRLAFDDVAQPPSSGELFAPAVVRDLRRGTEALALIRAHWGNGTVVHAVLVDSHVPDQSFRWNDVERLAPPRPTLPKTAFPTAVRRIRWKTGIQEGNPSGQRLGTSCRLQVTAGGVAIDKEYWFLRNARREVAWVSWDRLTLSPQWEGMVD